MQSLDLSPDGSQIVSTGGNQHETYIWNVSDGKVTQRLVGSGNAIWSVAWSKDGKSIAWGTSNTHDENGNGKLEYSFRLDEFGIGDVPDPSKYVQRVVTDDHVKVISGSTGFAVQTTGSVLTLIPAPPGERIYATTVLPKGNAVIVACSDSVRMLDPVRLERTAVVRRPHRLRSVRDGVARWPALRDRVGGSNHPHLATRPGRAAAVGFRFRPRLDRVDAAGLLRLLRRKASG